MTDYSLDSVVKEQVVLGQMLVCYESILTGESRALSSQVFHNWGSQSPRPVAENATRAGHPRELR